MANHDRVMETSTTTGLGAYALTGAVAGYQSFAAVGDGKTCDYAAWAVDGNGAPTGAWETGVGTYTASGTMLARTTVLASSNSGSAVSWSAGTKRVACSPLASSTDPNVPYVLEFTGEAGCVVDHNIMWGLDAGTSYGASFWWEAWVRVGGSGYMIASGYAGAHLLLWGFNGTPELGYTFTGNVYSDDGGGRPISYSGKYAFALDEWAHVAIHHRANKIYLWVNGIGETIAAFPGNRVSPGGVGSGSEKLFVGGSDHDNLPMRLAAIRGFDKAQISPQTTFGFAPERTFLPVVNTEMIEADFLAEYVNPQPGLIPDLSEGTVSVTGGNKVRHHGRRMDMGNAASAFVGNFKGNRVNGPNPPTWVLDAGCPYGQGIGSPLPNEMTHTPAAVPSGAVVFDSAGRRNQTWAFQNPPSLGSTEGGSAGPLLWHQSTAQPVFGIIDGRFAFLGNSRDDNYYAEYAYVDCGLSDFRLRVTRGDFKATAGTESATLGIAFRGVDNDNYWCLYCTEYNPGGANSQATIAPIVAGAADGSEGSNFFNPGDHRIFEIRANGTTIEVWTSNDNATWVLRKSITSSVHQTGTRVGLSAPINSSLTEESGFMRASNITVLPPL